MTHEHNKDGWSEIDQSVTIARPAAELYDIWRDLEALPGILSHVKQVRTEGERHSHWTVEGPLGTDVEWDSVITSEIPGKRITWHSVPDSEVENEGSVEFTETFGSGSTQVRVQISYRPPAGKIGTVVAALFGKNPAGQVEDDLEKFKESVEAGSYMRHSMM